MPQEALGLIKIQIDFEEKKLQLICRKRAYHGIFHLTLNIIPCFFGHTNKSSFTICCCSNSRDLQMVANEIS